MARGEQQAVTQRKVIGTLEDQHKYQMPDSRRLRVTANPVVIPVASKVSGVNQLANALAEVKPEIMDWAINRQVDQNVAEIEQGKLDATKGLSPEEQRSYLQQKGYDYQSTILKSEDLSTRLNADIASKDPEQDFGEWYQDWWAKNGEGMLPTEPDNLEVFNKVYSKGLVTARDYDIKAKVSHEIEKRTAVASEFLYRELDTLRNPDNPLPVTTDAWDAWKRELQLLHGMSNQEVDVLLFTVISDYGLDKADLGATDVFYQKRGEVPALVNNPKYTDKIRKLRQDIITKKNSTYEKSEKQQEADLKKVSDIAERNILLELNRVLLIEDPLEKAEKLAGLQTALEDNVNLGLLIDKSVIKEVQAANTKFDKEEETEATNTEYEKMLLNIHNLSTKDFVKARQDGKITKAGRDKLISTKDSMIKAAEADARREKPFYKQDIYTDAEKAIKSNIASSGGFVAGIGYSRSQKEAAWETSALAMFKRKVMSRIHGENPVPLEQAISESKKETLDFIKENKWDNKELEKATDLATASEGKTATKETNPYAYYFANSSEFDADFKAGKLPKELTPENKSRLKRKLEEDLIAERKKKATSQR